MAKHRKVRSGFFKKAAKFVALPSILGLLAGALSFSYPATAAATPFGCNPGFYQVVAGGQLKTLNFTTSSYDNVGSAPLSGQYNAMGYNSDDGYIYGIQLNTSAQGSSLVKVASDGSVTNLGFTSPALPTTYNFYGGDFDSSGNLVVNNTNGEWYKVNVSAQTATQFTITSGAANLPDFAIISNVAYGVGSGSNSLKRVDLSTGAVTSVNVTGLPAGTYGAAFVTNGTNLFVSNNSTGAIYRISDYSSTATASIFVTAGATNNNDGAACPTASLPAAAPSLSFSLAYDLGGGTGTTPATVTGIAAGESNNLADGSGFSRAGYTFAGWNCDRSIGAKAAGDALVQPTADVMCTAQWTPVAATYQLSYDLGGGTGTTPSTVTGISAGASNNLADGSGFSRAGYTFAGWNCDNSIGAKAAGDAVTQPAANVACTAQWTPAPPYTLSYDLGGGSGTVPAAVTGINPGDSNNLAGDTGFSRAGFVFKGWDCDNSVGSKNASDPVVQPAGNVVCTAIWDPAQDLAYTGKDVNGISWPALWLLVAGAALLLLTRLRSLVRK